MQSNQGPTEGQLAMATAIIRVKLESNPFSPEFRAFNIGPVLTAFKALPYPPTEHDRKNSVWTIHLQYPTTYFETKDEEHMEITVYKPSMLHPVEFPVERSLISKAEKLPYLLSVILKVFTEESKKLLEPDFANYESNIPAGEGEQASTSRTTKSVLAHTPAGMVPTSAYSSVRKKPVGKRPTLVLYRPTQIYFRDARLYGMIYMHAQYFGLKELEISTHTDFGRGYAKNSGTSGRRDVTLCALLSCKSMSMKHSRCSKCLIAHYCSAEHQKQDWPIHKVVCKHTRDYHAGYEAARRSGELSDVQIVDNIVFGR